MELEKGNSQGFRRATFKGNAHSAEGQRNLEITTQIGDPRMNGGTGTDTFDALAPSVNATGFEVFPLDVL